MLGVIKMASLGTVDIIVFVVLLLFSVLISFYFAYVKPRLGGNRVRDGLTNENKQDSTEEYLSTKSSMGIMPVAFSLMASAFSAIALVGIPTEVYQHGIDYWLVGLGFATPPLLGAFVFGPFFSKLHDTNSVFDYIEKRYSSKHVKQLAIVCYLLRTVFSAAFIMLGPATAVSLLLGMSQSVTIVLIGSIGTMYTTVGGLRAVIWTDMFQALIMIVSVILISVKGIMDAGGWNRMWEINKQGGRLQLIRLELDPFVRQSFGAYYFGAVVYYSINYCFDQQMLQRFKAAKTKRQAQIALLLNTPIVIFFISFCCLIGLVTYANYASCDPLELGLIQTQNQYSSYFVLNNMYEWPGSIGLFLVALFSSSLSSLASCLNAMAFIIWQDFLRVYVVRRELTDRAKLNINRLVVVLCGLISIGLCFVFSSIRVNISQLNNAIVGTFNAPILGLFLLSMFFSVSNRLGVIIGTLAGLVTMIILTTGTIITNPAYPKLNTSIESCSNRTETIFSYPGEDLKWPSRFFALSFLWYTTFGALVTILVGFTISLASGGLRSARYVTKELLVLDLTKILRKISSN